MAHDTKNKTLSLGEEIVETLISMTDAEKTVALAMMRGMVIGKQIAEQNQNKPA